MPSYGDLRTLLLNQSGITNVVGTSGVYVGDSGQNGLTDYVILNQEGVDPKETLSGTTGIQFENVDVDCYAASYADLETLSEAVTDSLKDYSGTVGTTTIHAVNWNDSDDDVVPAEDGSSNHRYLRTINFTLQWE